jgi:hypothetical protein
MSAEIASPTAPTVRVVHNSNSSVDDKSNQKRFHGFIAGVTSGVTKLVVGHPFGNTNKPTHRKGIMSIEIKWSLSYRILGN